MDFSVWSDSVVAPEFGRLEKDIECEVLVIGGGMAGILTAYMLSQHGVNAVVVEGQKVGSGVTKNTTAVISAQHDTLYHQLARKHGQEGARQYLTANLFAVEEFVRLSKMGIECDLEIKPSVIYSKTDKRTMLKEAEFLRSVGYEAKVITDTDLPFSIAAGVRFDGMAQFNPLKFLYALAQKVEVYEDTFVTEVKGNTAFTKDFKIKADSIVVASHFPFINSRGLYFLKMCQRRSYVLGLKNAQKLDATYTSFDGDGLYFRDYDDLLLLGGVDRRVGKHICAFEPVRAAAKQLYPHAEEEYAFAAQDCITLDGVPYIGRYGAPKSLYVATGFNEWGMTSSMVSARIISDMILGEANSFSEVFSPRRSMLRGQLFKNLGTVLASFVTPTVKRCSHLGCALKFNRKERIWECPCHGSRFSEDGRLIDNPAMKDANV